MELTEKIIFIHIPKTGGGSVAKYFNKNKHKHHPIHNFTDPKYRNWFKFTIIRDPWTRLFSTYNWVRESGYHKNQPILGSEGNATSFDKWINENFEHFKGDFPIIEHNPHWSGHQRLDSALGSPFWFSSQLAWLCDKDGKLLVDRCINFHNMHQEFSSVLSQLNLPIRPLDHENKSKNTKKHHELYTPKLIEKVHEFYKNEIEKFGFSYPHPA